MVWVIGVSPSALLKSQDNLLDKKAAPIMMASYSKLHFRIFGRLIILPQAELNRWRGLDLQNDSLQFVEQREIICLLVVR